MDKMSPTCDPAPTPVLTKLITLAPNFFYFFRLRLRFAERIPVPWQVGDPGRGRVRLFSPIPLDPLPPSSELS